MTLPFAPKLPEAGKGNLRRAGLHREHFPRWMEDPLLRERVLRVYAAYLDHKPVSVICRENHISPNQFYSDLLKGRQELRFRFQSDMEHISMEQVATRRAIINRVYTDYEQMTASTEVPLARKQEIHMEQLRLVTQNETAIEELLMVGGVAGAIQDLPPQTDRVLVIDLSSRNPEARRQLSAPIDHQPASDEDAGESSDEAGEFTSPDNDERST